MSVRPFPRLKFRVVHTGKKYRYTLDADTTVRSLQSCFSRDSGHDLSDFHLRVNAPIKASGYSDGQTLVETDLLFDLMDTVLVQTQQRRNAFDVQFAREGDILPIRNGCVPILRRVFGHGAAAGLRRQRTALAQAAMAGRGRRRDGRPNHVDTSHIINSSTVLHISVHEAPGRRQAPLIKVNEDSIATLTYDLPEANMVYLRYEATVGELRTELGKRIGSKEFQMYVPGHTAPIPAFDDDLKASEHALQDAGSVIVRRTGEGVAKVRFGPDALLEIPVSFNDGLDVLIRKVRARCPTLRGVQFHLRVNGRVLAQPEEDESLGCAWDGVGELVVTFEEKVAYSGSQKKEKGERKEEAKKETGDKKKETGQKKKETGEKKKETGEKKKETVEKKDSERVQRVDDMNDFLRLQSLTFNRKNANKLAPIAFNDFLKKINAELMQQPVDAPLTTQLLRHLPPTSFPPDPHPETAAETLEEGQVSIVIPFEAARFITVYVKDAETDRVVEVDSVTASTFVHVFRRKLETLLRRNLNRYMLGYNGRFIVDEDRSLRELGILHGCRMVLEYEDDFESVGSSQAESVISEESD